jgi:sensor histidine kinase YesM
MKSLKMLRSSRLFLRCILGGFVLGTIFFSLILLQYPHVPGREIRKGLVLLAIYVVTWSVLWQIVMPVIDRMKDRLPFARYIIFVFVVILLSALLVTWIAGHLILFIYPDFNVLRFTNYLTIASYSLLFGVPWVLYQVVRELWRNALQKVREKEVAGERLEKELLAARLQALQAQTNPHFLCNALNSIATLIAMDPASAENAVERLAGLFRYATDSHSGRFTPLADEIGVIEDYLAIEKIRFGERLNVQIAVDPSIEKCFIPPLLLQPLVENAIKHGVSQREEPTTIEITAKPSEGDQLRFIVRNQGAAPSPEESWTGVGLKNVQSRCRTLFGDTFRFRLTATSPGWVQAELVIPRGNAAGQSDQGERHE